MKKAPLQIDENELDQLLRQLVLDGGSDEFTLHTTTMNAELIFNSPAATIPAHARETALIQQLENDFVKRRGFGRFWLNGIILLCIISAAVWLYKVNSANTIMNSQQQSQQENNFQPAITSDTSDETTAFVVQTNVQNDVALIPQDSILPDSFSKQSPPKKEHFVTPDSHMAIEPNWYEGNYIVDEKDHPGPVFSAKASPENYKAAQGKFRAFANVESLMFAHNPDSFAATYYTGVPFKSGMNDLQYFNYGEYAQTAEDGRWGLPPAILYYADPEEVKAESIAQQWGSEKRSYSSLFLHKIPAKGIELAVQPFYFRKFEVTNLEYREFLNWVRASNGYADKAIMAVSMDTVEVKDPKDKSGEQFIIKGKTVRIVRKTTVTEDFKDVFNYIFFNKNSEAVNALKKTSLYIFPDTLSWINDFSFSYNEPMSNMYFWHPAYDAYPVVGVSWYQAMAFLDWKTHMHQKQLDAEKVPYEIEYMLPSDIEWELASISIVENKKTGFDMRMLTTSDWLTNLGVSFPGKDDPYQRPNYLKNLFTKDEYYRGDYISDGYFHTGPADLSRAKNSAKPGTHHLDPLGISWMDGNVSEWMRESYAENWKPFFDKHLAVLAMDTSESTQLAKQIEALYDKGNASNGRLVRGANWYDERFSGRPSAVRNEAGINPKRFVDPSEQHSTIGFRYVVHVKRK